MILITGASGNVGREVLKQMIQSGRPIRAAFQSASKAATAPAGVETVILDYKQPETMSAALRDIESVFLVGPVVPNLPELEQEATDEIKRSGVRHIVKLSAMGSDQAIFPRQHRKSEDYIQSCRIEYTFLRPNGFMQNMVVYNGSTIQTQGAFYGSQGHGKVSYVDIRDVAAVAVRVLTDEGHFGRTYTLTGPEALSASDVAEILSAAASREIKYVDLPSEQMKQALMSAGVPEWNAEGIVDLDRLYRSGGASLVTNDIERILSRKPTGFEQFARDYAQLFRSSSGAAG